jgi:hypothetical protein
MDGYGRTMPNVFPQIFSSFPQNPTTEGSLAPRLIAMGFSSSAKRGPSPRLP